MYLPTQFWHLFSDKSIGGPTVVIMGGTHGDELIGPEVVRRILAPLGCLGHPTGGRFSFEGVRGQLKIGFGNPEAIRMNTRGASGPEKPDLNRSFMDEELRASVSADDREDLRRARELEPILECADFLFDIHSTNLDSPPFVCFGDDTPHHRELYRRMPVEIILTDPDRILAKDFGAKDLGTTDSVVNTRGGTAWSIKRYGYRRGIGLAYETGQCTDLSGADPCLATIMGLLLHVGVVTKGFATRIGVRPANRPPLDQRVYRLSNCISAKHATFAYEPGMHKGWQRVAAGTVIGHYANGDPEICSDDGMLLFNRDPAKITVGRSLYYLAQEIAHLSGEMPG